MYGLPSLTTIEEQTSLHTSMLSHLQYLVNSDTLKSKET